MHCKPEALPAWFDGIGFPLSVKLWRHAMSQWKSFSTEVLLVQPSVSKHVTVMRWNVRTSKGTCPKQAHTHTRMHACTAHRALHAWLRCPQANPPLCVSRSRAEATRCGASAGESNRPRRARLTLTLWMRLKYFYSVREIQTISPAVGTHSTVKYNLDI